MGMLCLIHKDQNIYFKFKQFASMHLRKQQDITGAKCAYSVTNYRNIQNSMAAVLAQQQN